MSKIKLLISFCILLIFSLSFTACYEESEEPVSKTEYQLLNTVCSISIYGMEEERANKILEGAFELCRKNENLLSKTVESSDIYRINKTGGSEVEVKKKTYDLLEKGVYYGELSDGKFDISLGELSALWHFQTEEPELPNPDEISEKLPHVNYKNLLLSESKGKYYAQLMDGEASIDLGGIAKGYIADEVAAYMEKKGVKSGLVNLGGNIVAIGHKPDGGLWKIGIEKPYSERKEVVGYVEVEDATIVTSGIYERGFEKEGEFYHHILDVKTGYPVKSDVESVSILAKKGSSADADALSSICLILGSEKAMKLIESIEGVEAGFILKDGKIVSTENMNLKIMM